MNKPRVSVVIPTHNRPDLVGKAIESVLRQTWQDFEIIVVDDGLENRAETTVRSLSDSRIVYIKHDKERGGAAARNTGIKNAQGEYVAFLDDDDEWMPEKLRIQMSLFQDTPENVGFCFSAVINNMPNGQVTTLVYDGVKDFHEDTLGRFNGFLTVTLILKKIVFEQVGDFDERFPSHQEPELMIRVTKKFKGLGINKPLVLVDMTGSHEQIGSKLTRKIAGRKMILDKYQHEYQKIPKVLARHYFWLAIMYRDNKNFKEAEYYLSKAFLLNKKMIYLLHFIKLYLHKYIKK